MCMLEGFGLCWSQYHSTEHVVASMRTYYFLLLSSVLANTSFISA